MDEAELREDDLHDRRMARRAAERAELARLRIIATDHAALQTRANAIDDENERLRDVERRLIGEASKIGAERDALRAALRELDLLMDFNEPVSDDKPMVFGDAALINRAMKQAREALGDEQTPQADHDEKGPLPTAKDVRGIIPRYNVPATAAWAAMRNDDGQTVNDK